MHLLFSLIFYANMDLELLNSILKGYVKIRRELKGIKRSISRINRKKTYHVTSSESKVNKKRAPVNNTNTTVSNKPSNNSQNEQNSQKAEKNNLKNTKISKNSKNVHKTQKPKKKSRKTPDDFTLQIENDLNKLNE